MSGEPKTHTTQVWAGRVEVLVDKERRVIHKISFELPPGFTFAEPTADGVPVVARDEAAELRAALRTLVTDLEDLMEESHLSLYDGDGALVDTSWGKVLQGGKDEYLSNWRDVKRLAGGESER